MPERKNLPEAVLIGGNHLANYLIGHGDDKMPNDYLSYESAREERGMDYADVWACWKAIMDNR